MSVLGWILIAVFILAMAGVDLFFRGRRQEKAAEEATTTTAERLRAHSPTFEGQLQLATDIYYNNTDDPFANPDDAIRAAVTGMSLNWPQYTPYDIRDFILGERPAEPSGGTAEETPEDLEESHVEHGLITKSLATEMWNTLQFWKQNPNELFKLLPVGGQKHFSRSEKIEASFLEVLSPCSGKLSHELYSLTEEDSPNLNDFTVLDSMIWYLAVQRSEPEEVADEDVFTEQRSRVLAEGKAEQIASIWDLTEQQLLDEDFLVALGHPEWHPANWAN